MRDRTALGPADVDDDRLAACSRCCGTPPRATLLSSVAEPDLVPPELREWAAMSVPWQAEPLAYRSTLAGALPLGLRMPRPLAVVDLDEESRAIWLEAIDAVALRRPGRPGRDGDLLFDLVASTTA